MRRTTALLTAAVPLTFLTASCGAVMGDCLTAEGAPERREVALTGDFTELVNDASLDIDIRHGDVASVTIVAAPNLQDAILVKESGGKLTIDTKSGCYRNTDWRAEVVTPGLREVYNDGSGGVTAQGLYGRDGKLRLYADGSGEIRLESPGDVRELEAETGGSGGIELRGLPALASLSVVCDGSGGVEVDGAVDVERLTVRLERNLLALVSNSVPKHALKLHEPLSLRHNYYIQNKKYCNRSRNKYQPPEHT